jgi:CRP/FNR family transcriptional activator FtrB
MLRDRDIEAVRELAPFTAMKPDNFERLVTASYLQRFPKDIVLIEEGDPADMLHIVVEGAVEMYSEHAGRRTTVAIFHPISAIILSAVVKDLPYLLSARTLEPSRILLIPASTIQETIRSDPGFAYSVIDELAMSFRRMTKTLKDQKLRHANVRIANFLLRLRARNGDADRVALPMEKGVTASLLGMTRENFSRSLSVLRDEGVVVRGNEVEFRDAERLRAFAQPNPLIDDPDS